MSGEQRSTFGFDCLRVAGGEHHSRADDGGRGAAAGGMPRAAHGSRLAVLSGRVELEGHGQRALVPAGMWSVTQPGRGPSAPIDRHATPALISAVERLEQDPSVLPMLLRQADRLDAATLWHLLARTEGEARRAVYARLQELVPAPVDEAAVLGLDPVALDEWWRACLASRD